VFAPDSLAEHERVLRADGGDQGERSEEADDQRRGHVSKVGRESQDVQLIILGVH
jgi:hypothetical protein